MGISFFCPIVIFFYGLSIGLIFFALTLGVKNGDGADDEKHFAGDGPLFLGGDSGIDALKSDAGHDEYGDKAQELNEGVKRRVINLKDVSV